MRTALLGEVFYLLRWYRSLPLPQCRRFGIPERLKFLFVAFSCTDIPSLEVSLKAFDGSQSWIWTLSVILGIGFLAFYEHITKHRLQNEEAAGTTSPPEVSTNLSPSSPHSTHFGGPNPRPQHFKSFVSFARRIKAAFQCLPRWVVGMVFLCGNGLVVIMPLVLIDSHHTFLLTKPTWVLTVVVGSVYCAGALAAIYILTICVGFKFDQGRRPEGPFKHKLGWMLEYPVGNPSQFFKPSRPGCLCERLWLDEANLPTDFEYLVSDHVGLGSTT